MMSTALPLGEKVPDFELPEASTKMIRLSEVYQTHTTVIAFYPSDFGMMCAVELMQLSELYPQFQALGAEILGISTNSTYSHVGWKTRIYIPFPLLADFEAKVTELYDVLEGEIGYMEGRSKRSIFIIDRQGVLRYRWITDNPALEPDYQELLKVCAQLQ